MTYREPDKTAQIEELREELEAANQKVAKLKTSRLNSMVDAAFDLLRGVRAWHFMVLAGLPAAGFAAYYIAKLPPRPQHSYVTAKDGRPALQNHCGSRDDCYEEAKNECRAGHDEIEYQEKHGNMLQCTPLCTSDGKTMTCTQICTTVPTYDGWLTYRCRPETPQ